MAPVQFGYGLYMERFELFRSLVLTVPPEKVSSCMPLGRRGSASASGFWHNGSGGSVSPFGSWKNGSDGSVSGSGFVPGTFCRFFGEASYKTLRVEHPRTPCRLGGCAPSRIGCEKNRKGLL